jgi:tetratricopeptide (TPR) repeat protein
MLANERSMDQVIDAITTRSSHDSNFALFLGAGASITSGVPGAKTMIDDWRKRLYKRSQTNLSYDKWLKNQQWKDTDEEYSVLFEQAFDTLPLRRAYVETCMQNARPNWGYVYLTTLLEERYFRVVFTTNFDDLLNEACYLYSDKVRPIVTAHDSAVRGIRITSDRPKIIKLHGDFLFENIKNTVRELETLEENMKRKFMSFAGEYGLVVVGYGGNDRSIMDILDILSRQGDYFKQGVYWCLLNTEQHIGNKLSTYLKRDNVYLARIPGFDQFMAEIHHKAGLNLPEPVVNPLWMARDRARLYADIPAQVKNYKLISQDISKVLESVNGMMTAALTPADSTNSSYISNPLAKCIPPLLRAEVVAHQQRTSEALEQYKLALEEDPDDEEAATRIAESLYRLNRIPELLEFANSHHSSDKPYYLLLAGDNEAVIRETTKALRQEPESPRDRMDRAIDRINRAIAYKRLGKTRQLKKDLEILAEGETSPRILAAISALKRDKKNLIKYVNEALEQGSFSPDNLEIFPAFEDFAEDPDFLNILRKKRRELR